MTNQNQKIPMRFAVVIPLYNHAPYIAAALESVLDQTRPADQIILIDDGSTDEGYFIAESLLRDRANVVLQRQENIGAHATLNRCIELADADYIAVLNSDDIFPLTKLADCERIVVEHEDIDFIFGRVELIDADGSPIVSGETFEWLKRALAYYDSSKLLIMSLVNENFAVTTSNMVFSKAIWQRNDRFQPLRYCHDLDFILTSTRTGNVFFDDTTPHIEYRVHASNTIKETVEKVRLEIAAVIAVSLAENNISKGSARPAEENASILLGVLKQKECLNSILPLIAIYRSISDRSEFYHRITSPEFSNYLSTITKISEPESHALVRTTTPPRIKDRLQRLTIAIEVSSFDKGGLEKVVLDTALSFKERKINPIVITGGDVGHLGKLAGECGIEVIQLPEFGREAFYRSILKSRGVESSISHFSRIGYPVFRELNIPNITFIHNVYAMLTGAALSNFKADDKYVERYISVSRNATRYANETLGVDIEKIVTIPNGLILKEHQQRFLTASAVDRGSLGLLNSDYVFLNVASYNLHKAHYLMASAMQHILECRDDIKILCVGNEIHPPHVAELRQYLTANGLDKNILMPGYFADVAPLHAISDAFILPSFIEGWSIAMTEAMFYGKPMILTDTGASAEVISNSDIGLLIPNEYGDTVNLDAALLDEIAYRPRNYITAPLLATAMMRFADEKAAWREAGRKGRLKVLRSYDFDAIVEKYISIINEVVVVGRG